MKENQNLSTSDIHDSGVRTLCISEPKEVHLEKVLTKFCYWSTTLSTSATSYITRIILTGDFLTHIFTCACFQIRTWIEEILWEKKYDMDVYRCKGILNIANSDQLYTLQVKDYTFLRYTELAPFYLL